MESDMSTYLVSIRSHDDRFLDRRPIFNSRPHSNDRAFDLAPLLLLTWINTIRWTGRMRKGNRLVIMDVTGFLHWGYSHLRWGCPWWLSCLWCLEEDNEPACRQENLCRRSCIEMIELVHAIPRHKLKQCSLLTGFFRSLTRILHSFCWCSPCLHGKMPRCFPCPPSIHRINMPVPDPRTKGEKDLGVNSKWNRFYHENGGIRK